MININCYNLLGIGGIYMEISKLTKQDFEWLEGIIQTTSSIESLYKKLYDLEINGQKDTKEYTKLLDYLSIAVSVEDKIYKEANLDYSKCMALSDYIIGDRIPSGFVNDMESIMTQNYNNRVLRRILSILIHRMTSDYSSVREMLPSEVIYFMRQSGVVNPEQHLLQAIRSNIAVQEAFERETIGGFMIFLQEAINKRDYRNLQEYLICSKYNMSFINKNIEMDMRIDRFEITGILYYDSWLVADLNQMDLNLCRLLREYYGVSKSTEQIAEIIGMRDTDYLVPVKNVMSILRQCLMRSAFLLMGDDAISDVNSSFHDLVESREYLERHSEDCISEQAIINCFKGIRRDRNKFKSLSLKYK